MNVGKNVLTTKINSIAAKRFHDEKSETLLGRNRIVIITKNGLKINKMRLKRFLKATWDKIAFVWAE